ncbi:MAG TPA: helical backbone metal receptor [Thermoanaerobaculia bacterium]|nr:helical backbone metal receptor [Thermoanaerobaculia bacterium]
MTLAPNVTEIVYALGSGDAIVGTDDFSDFPAAAKNKPKVGGMQPSLEKLAALKPDLVIATTNGNHPSLAPALAALHVPLFVLRTERLEDIPREMQRLGAALGSPRRDAAVAELRRSIEAQRRTRPTKRRVLFCVWAEPLYVAGRKTFTDDLLLLTGAENAVPVDGWPQYSLESLAAHPPDIILYPDREVSRAQVAKLLELVHAEAVAVDENLFTRPGPRVGEAAARLNAILDGKLKMEN